MVTKADYTVTLDATEDKTLLSLQGLVARLGGILDGLLQSDEALPRVVEAVLIYPDDRMAGELHHQIDKLNKVIHPRGFMDKIAHAAFRSMSGVEGDLKPIVVDREPGNPNMVRLNLDLSGISRDDVARFSEFLAKNAHRLA